MVPATGGNTAQDAGLTPAQELALEAEEAAREEAARQAPRAAPAPVSAGAQSRFTVRGISVPPSRYLDRAAIDAVVSQLVGRRVSLRDAGRLVAPLNALYRERGIGLANVVIREIDIARGLVELDLYEPLIGRVSSEDGTLARGSVYTRRLGLEAGSLADTRRIEARQTRLELLSGVTTEIVVGQGDTADALDLTVTPVEPPALRFSATFDTHGSQSSGREQVTLSLSHASLLGQLDAASVSVTMTEGVRSGALGYAFPLTADGLAVFAAGSYEKEETISGPRQTTTSWSAELGLSYPVILERERQLTVRASVQRFDEERRIAGVLASDQGGTAFVLGATFSRSFSRGWFAYDQTVRYVDWDAGVFGAQDTTLFGGEFSSSLLPSADWQLFSRLGWQYARGDNSPARFRTTLSSPTRVRGYPSDTSSGDGFVFGSIQVQRIDPIRLSTDDMVQINARPFVFVDAGRAYDRVGGSTFSQDLLISTGAGGVFQIGRRVVAEAFIAKPLRDTNFFNAGNKWRADIRIGVSF